MKLNFFINTLGGGGAEKVLVDLVNQLPVNYDITVTTLLHGIHENKLATHIKHKCIIKTRRKLFIFIIERLYCKLLPYKLFAKLFLNGDYDIIVSYLEGFNTHVLAAYNGNAKRISFVHCNTGTDGRWTLTYKSNQELIKQYNSFDRVCFISQDALDGFNKAVGCLANSCVVHNVIDYKTAISFSNDYVTDVIKSDYAGTVRLISVGRLTRVKGFERLIRVIARLKVEGISCDLCICGEGEDRKELESLVMKLHLENVYFLGFQQNPYKYMRNSDIYVCSSYSEGYSTSVAESIAIGTPVLTTDCSGMREILCEGKYGDIVENSEKGLYAGLKKIIGDKEHYKRLKANVAVRSRELIAQNPVKEYVELFDSLNIYKTN